MSENALIGMGLWLLLWFGYNTDIGHVMEPNWPTNNMDMIHGLRAFFPLLAAWFACLLIFARSARLFRWIMGPVGLILFYTIIGLISSITLSINKPYALYYGGNYLAIVLVLLAISLVENPLDDLLKVLRVTWVMGMILTVALLGAIPFLGSQVIIPTEASPIGVRAYGGLGTVMGMAATRNTGFARYAAVSALALLPALMRKGRPIVRVALGALLLASLYALVLANGRTETGAFVVSLIVIMAAEKAKRTLYFLAGIGGAIILGLRGFYTEFYVYITRGGRLDPTLTGRTAIWEDGWHLFLKSPLVGFGFQADRFYLNWHMHNAFLHVLVQSGLLGGLAILLALGIVWYYTIYYFFTHQPEDKSLIPAEIPAILLFTTLSSVTESTFAYYSAAWLLCAPVVPYVMALHMHMRKISLRAAQERILRARLAKRRPREMETPLQVLPPDPGNGNID